MGGEKIRLMPAVLCACAVFLEGLFPLLAYSQGALPLQPSAPSETMAAQQGDIPDWMARWELARVLSYAKRYDESIAEYKRLLKERPSQQGALVEMANVLFWKGDKDAAMAVLDQIPAKNIDDKTKLLMADVYLSRKEYAKAEPLYRAALKNIPSDQKTRLKLAQMLSWMKRYDESLLLYENILKARPDDIQVRRKYAYVLMWAGKFNEAAEELKRTLK